MLTGEFEREAREIRENNELYPEMPSNRSDDVDTYIDYQLRIFNNEFTVSI